MSQNKRIPAAAWAGTPLGASEAPYVTPQVQATRLRTTGNLAPIIASEGYVGVTIVSPSYAHMAAEAVGRFQRNSGLEVITLHVTGEPSFAAKLNLDLLVAPRPIIFFDVDWWLLRKFDFADLGTSSFQAVHDPGVNGDGFPVLDCKREGWTGEQYFNSGFFACDLGRPEIRRVFADARARLAACHDGTAAKPADYGDQFFLNWAVAQQPGLVHLLDCRMNFFKSAVDWGYFPYIPGGIIGLHAAGLPVNQKLDVLRREASVFGPLAAAARY